MGTVVGEIETGREASQWFELLSTTVRNSKYFSQ